MSNIKKYLKKFIPASYNKVEVEGKRVQKQIEKKLAVQAKEIAALQSSYLNGIKTLQQLTENNLLIMKDLMTTKTEKTNSILRYQYQNMCEMMQHYHEEYLREIDLLNEENSKLKRTVNEIVWAHVFDDTIVDSTWLKDKTFSPGRWAMGYVELYVLYRILNEFRPQSILELGLGQSTKMITQYALANPEAAHKVVEHDGDWISFYEKNNSIPDNTEIVQLDREMMPYKEAESVRVFKGFAEKFSNNIFDFIMIDAPLGGDMKDYSRIDVLSIIPECLAESFVIVLDDAERHGERKTAQEIDKKLKENGIEFRRAIYSGEKDFCIWTSPEWGFLCSM